MRVSLGCILDYFAEGSRCCLARIPNSCFCRFVNDLNMIFLKGFRLSFSFHLIRLVCIFFSYFFFFFVVVVFFSSNSSSSSSSPASSFSLLVRSSILILILSCGDIAYKYLRDIKSLLINVIEFRL